LSKISSGILAGVSILLVGDFCQFAAHQIQVGVDRLLVVLVDLGQGKQRDKG